MSAPQRYAQTAPSQQYGQMVPFAPMEAAASQQQQVMQQAAAFQPVIPSRQQPAGASLPGGINWGLASRQELPGQGNQWQDFAPQQNPPRRGGSFGGGRGSSRGSSVGSQASQAATRRRVTDVIGASHWGGIADSSLGLVKSTCLSFGRFLFIAV
jgi:hypothetical protein